MAERELDSEIRACGNCEYWVEHEALEEDWGRCHRFPPTLYGTRWRFPKVHREGHWCGEFVQKLKDKLKIEVEEDVEGTGQQQRDDQSQESEEH